MLDGIKEDLERQVARLLEEAERPMRVEEILPHLDPVMPTPNDVAEVLQELTDEKRIEREGSYFHRSTPLPLERLFGTPEQRADAQVLVDVIRELSAREERGAGLRRVLRLAQERGVPRDRALDVLAVLRNAGEAYSAGGDRLRLAKP